MAKRSRASEADLPTPKRRTKGAESSVGSFTSGHPCEPDVQITDVQPAKQRLQLGDGPGFMPLNNARDYSIALEATEIYPVVPSAHALMRYATENGLLNVVVYGAVDHRVIENLVLDNETNLIWQIPKVTVEYQRISYTAIEQPYTTRLRKYEGQEVSPASLPDVKQMTASEYENAVDIYDSRIAPHDKDTLEFCGERCIGWVPYKNRGVG